MVLAITCKHEFPRRWAQSRQQQTSRLLSSCGVFQAANRSRSSASNTRLYAAICAFVPGKAYFTKRQHINAHSLRTSSQVVASSATPLQQTIDPETGGYSRSFLLVRVAVFFRYDHLSSIQDWLTLNDRDAAFSLDTHVTTWPVIVWLSLRLPWLPRLLLAWILPQLE